MRIPADPTIPDVVRVLRDMEKRMDYIQGIAVAPQLRGPMDANGQRILNVADPVSDRDAVNKKRGDADYAPKAAYYVTTQGDGTLTNEKVLTAGSGISVTVGGSTVTVAATGAGTGDVVGPASAVDSNFAAFDTTTGKLIKDSGSAASSFATAAHTQTAAAGGTGIDTSASTGVPLVTAGTWSVLSTTGTGNVVRATSPTITTPTMSSPTISDRLLVVSGGSITLPNSTTSMVGTDTAQVITSKSFVDGASCTFVDNGDNTKKLAFECSGITTGTTRTLTVPNASGTIALTADLASYQPLDADLTAIAALTTTAFGRGLLTETDASTTRTTLGLVIGTNVQAYDADLASWAGVTRASGFDTFAATPSGANFDSLLTDSIPVTAGGTGRTTSTTAYGLIAAGTTATGAHQTLAAGATTEILVGGGASALPVWTAATGSGAPVRATSPTLVTPALGTPSSGDIRNCTGYYFQRSTYSNSVSVGTARRHFPITGSLASGSLFTTNVLTNMPACTLVEMRGWVQNGPTAPDTYTFRFRNTTAGTTSDITINSGGGSFSSTGLSLTISAGDLCCCDIINSAGSVVDNLSVIFIFRA